MTHFADRVVEAARRKQSCVCVGLDPRPDSLPAPLKTWSDLLAEPEAAAAAIVAFNSAIIDAGADVAVLVKPQVAFYEQLGAPGLRAYEDTVRLAREAGLIVIGDVKRGDIGSTAEAYAEAHLDRIGTDAVTLNPYLGWDSIEPFAKRCAAGHGAFILVRTSNASSSELQEWPRPEQPVWQRVAEMVRDWGAGHVGASGYSALGAVVGATFPETAAALRALMPKTLFLVPGYGAQGADAKACAACFNRDGLGAVVNSSRGIIFACRRAPYAETFGEAGWIDAVRQAALDMRADLAEIVKRQESVGL